MKSTDIFIKSVGGTGFDITSAYHKFADWSGQSPGEKNLYSLMSDKDKNTLATSKKVNIVLYAQWIENVLTIQYNVNGGESRLYPVDKNDNVLDDDGSNNIIQDKYKASSNDVWLINCDTEFGFNRVGNALDGYIINGETHPTEITNRKHTAVSLAPGLSTDDVTITVYAHWKPNIINVIYNANTGSINAGDYYLNETNSHISIGNNVFKQVVNYNESVKILHYD